MEGWENKIIADKLDGLQDLPDGYAPNIASKWEIIQSGLQNKKGYSKRRWLFGFLVVALLFIGGVVYRLKEPVSTNVQPSENKAEYRLHLPNGSAAIKIIEEEKVKAVEKTLKLLVKKQVPKERESKRRRVENIPVQPTKLQIDSALQIRVDTIKVSIPLADVKPIRQKKKTFQKDFEGFAGNIDSSHQKTAAKGFLIQWRSGRDKEAVSEQPRIRLTQNF